MNAQAPRLALALLTEGKTRPLPIAGVVALNAAPRRVAGVAGTLAYGLAARALARTAGQALDEVTLDLLATSLRLEVAELDLLDNHPVSQEGSDRARILHAMGPDTYWTATPLAHACPDWGAHHRTWLKAGGSPAPSSMLHADVHPLAPAAALSFACNRDFWQQLWPLIAQELPPEPVAGALRRTRVTPPAADRHAGGPALRHRAGRRRPPLPAVNLVEEGADPRPHAGADGACTRP